jgi:hypothetical protein
MKVMDPQAIFLIEMKKGKTRYERSEDIFKHQCKLQRPKYRRVNNKRSQGCRSNFSFSKVSCVQSKAKDDRILFDGW